MTGWRVHEMGDDYEQHNGIYVPPQQEPVWPADASAIDDALINGFREYPPNFAYTVPGPFEPPTDPRTWPTWNDLGKTITIPNSDYEWKD